MKLIFIEIAPCEECKNPESYGSICLKCGMCGRTFPDERKLEEQAEAFIEKERKMKDDH